MHYLITTAPVLLTHGNYHYHEISKEQALHWLHEHHKDLKLGQVTVQVGGHVSQINQQIVQLLSREIDRYIDPAQTPLPELKHHDEVLVVMLPTPQPGHPVMHNQQLTIGTLTFAMLKLGADQPTE